MFLAKVLLLTSIFTFVHDWYPPECCSGADCRMVLCDEIIQNLAGEYVYDGMIFLKDTVKESMDAFCHACYSTSRTPHCLFIQSGV